jgi:acetyltransferase-like isoleucine patch superfamily enzyme
MISTSAIISPTATIGDGCNIEAGAILCGDVNLGNGVHVGAGAILVGPCQIGNNCVIHCGVALDAGVGSGPVVLEDNVHLSAMAVIAAPVTIATGARIQAGTVIIRSVPPHAIVSGNPAQITGYTLSQQPTSTAGVTSSPVTTGVIQSRVLGVKLYRLPKILDLRGNLTAGEFGGDVPFLPKRHFMVFGVPNAEIRGEHAHRTCEQFLICAHGSCNVVADDGSAREEFVLDDPSVGLYLPPLTWGIQYKYSPDAVLLVFASEHYSSTEYIRRYSEFLELTTERDRPSANATSGQD